MKTILFLALLVVGSMASCCSEEQVPFIHTTFGTAGSPTTTIAHESVTINGNVGATVRTAVFVTPLVED